MYSFLQVSEEKIAELSRQLGITTVDYIDQCKKALCSNGGHKSFIYLLDGNLFLWKKIHSDVKITFGTIQLNNVIKIMYVFSSLGLLWFMRCNST